MEDMQPGQVIMPRGSNEPSPNDGAPNPDRRPTGPPEPTPPPMPPVPEPAAPAMTTVPIASPAPVAPTPMIAAAPPSAPAQTAGWGFHQEAEPTDPAADLPDSVSWTASEFIDHEKGIGWYAALAFVGLVATALVYLVTKDFVSATVIVLAAIVFATFAARKPRTQQYGLDHQGVQIGAKLYGFQDFKAFSVIEEGAIASIVLMPLKRFMPSLTIYVAPEMEEQAVGFLSAFLPFEQRKGDIVDSLLRRIRF